ncbi:MAG: sigma-54 dependent transcriptional regulator [Myxococcota bacterium]|nr:sigma-54 dependent transcriptional regulator [Myxococcota bacterium]
MESGSQKLSGRVLIIDDEPQMARVVERPLVAAGLEVETENQPERGLQRLREEPFDLLVTDLCMPGIDGIEVLKRARVIRPETEVVLMTAHATAGTAREALKMGAIDYLTKPFSVSTDLVPLVRNILESDAGPSNEDEPEETARAGGQAGKPKKLIGESQPMQKLASLAERVAQTSAPALLCGESGTGKEVVANLVHQKSARSSKPMLSINCAALSETLLESELFGHTRGSFTGAVKDQEGVFAAADGGTLFLDEIGEMALSIQPKLLRFLQEGEIRRVGDSSRVRRVDVRIIAATNRNLVEAVKNGSFRQDLYYRLAVVPINLPPLREHREDLGELIAHFLETVGSTAQFSEPAMQAMQRYSWPGNVRELANAVEHAVVLSTGSVLEIEDLPAAIQESETLLVGAAGPEEEETLDAIERRTILQTLQRTEYNRSQAARLLGVTRRTLGYRIRKYGLEDTIETYQGELQRNGATPLSA